MTRTGRYCATPALGHGAFEPCGSAGSTGSNSPSKVDPQGSKTDPGSDSASKVDPQGSKTDPGSDSASKVDPQGSKTDPGSDSTSKSDPEFSVFTCKPERQNGLLTGNCRQKNHCSTLLLILTPKGAKPTYCRTPFSILTRKGAKPTYCRTLPFIVTRKSAKPTYCRTLKTGKTGVASTSICGVLSDSFRLVNYTHESRVINATIRSELAGAQKSQRDLAEFLNISESAVSRRINGNFDWTFSDLTKIGNWIGTNLVRKADQNLVMDHHS